MYSLTNERLEELKHGDEELTYFGDLVAEMASELLQLRQRVAEMEEAARWIPVGERLPEMNGIYCQAVLMFMDDHNIREGYYDDGHWYFPLLDQPIMRIVTHWMPLPLPPQESEVG